MGNFGWVSRAVVDPEDKSFFGTTKLDASMPANMRSTALGVLGMPG